MYDEVRDYGFEEPDLTFLFKTTDEKNISILKNRHYFSSEYDEMDYDISYSILVDGKPFITFPKDVSRETAQDFAYNHFEMDEEATKELQSMYSEMEAERRMGC